MPICRAELGCQNGRLSTRTFPVGQPGLKVLSPGAYCHMDSGGLSVPHIVP